MTATGSLTLHRKLANLVEDLDERLDNEDNDRQYLLEKLLDRLHELAHDTTTDTTATDPADLCQRCGRMPATTHIYAANETGEQRAQTVCVHCTLQTITWAAIVGPVHVRPHPNREATR